MKSVLRATFGLPLLLIAAVAFAAPAGAQQAAPAAPATAPKPKKPPRPKPPDQKPDQAAAPAAQPAPATEGAQPTLLGMFGEWGAYTASPGGKKICFALAKPSKSETSPPNRSRDIAYLFVSTRPEERVKDEVSVLIGYPFKLNSEASAEVGSSSFALYTQQDGAWVKNAAEEAPMIAAMRGGTSIVIKGVSQRSTSSVDTFSLKGLAEAIDRADQECR